MKKKKKGRKEMAMGEFDGSARRRELMSLRRTSCEEC